MKLMTYNLFEGAVDQFEEVMQVIQEAGPDFLAINEANGFDLNDNERLKQLSQKTGLPHYDLARCGDGDEYHVAIFSKLPLRTVVHLPDFARAAIFSLVDTPIGELAIISTHLTPYSEAQRMIEAAAIIKQLAPYQRQVIMGDLNGLSPADGYDPSIIASFSKSQLSKFTKEGQLCFDVMQQLTEAGFVDPAVTFNQQTVVTAPTAVQAKVEWGANDNMRLDYILISPSLRDQLQSYAVIKGGLAETASDHYPVAITLG